MGQTPFDDARDVGLALLFFLVSFSVLYHGPALRDRWERVSDRLWPSEPAPDGRPIEDIAGHARRLGGQFHQVVPGRSFARVDGVRRAYDDVLEEGCRALGLASLLGVLQPGPELDTERLRVERVLAAAGFGLDSAA